MGSEMCIRDRSSATDIIELKALVENHLTHTGSSLAQDILHNWNEKLTEFVKVMPTDYKRVLAERAATAA